VNPGHTLRRRVLACLAAAGLALALLLARVLFLQSLRHGQLRAGAEQVRLRVIAVQPRRGLITDRNGRPLAYSIDVPTVYANPAEVREPAATARALAAVLGRDPAALEARLRQRAMFVWVARKVTHGQAQAIRRLHLPGIGLTEEGQRVYPRGALAAQVLGFAGIDGQGLAGVEYSYDSVLRGRPGHIEIAYDALNHLIPKGGSRYVPPVEGDQLRLTIDENLQAIAERDLAREVTEHGAKGGFVAMMDPNTGEILALAVYPSFDPNRYAQFDPRLWRDPFVSDTLSPGSVFKPVTAAAALNEGLITPETPFYDPGAITVPGAVIHDAPGSTLGATVFREGFTHSANVVFVQVGMRLGLERFYRYLDAFGLRGLTGIDLPGEARGLIPDPRRAKPVDLAVMSFGQTLTVTPVGMLSALGAIANGGELMWPHVGLQVLSPGGQVVRDIEPRAVRRVLSPQTSATLRELMRGVVQAGTGRRAQIPGYDVGGKTGTSNKVVGGIVSRSHYIASFAGIVPASHPRLVVYVVVDEPQGVYYGGFVSAPAFQTIVSDALRYLKVPPDHPDQVARSSVEAAAAVPSLLNLTPEQARQRAEAAGLRVEVMDGGPRVVDQVPGPGVNVVPGTLVLAYTTPAPPPEPAAVTVPDLSGYSLDEAAALLGRLGLQMDAAGAGAVTAQEPPPGTIVQSGTVVRLQLGPAAEGRRP
jgi:stage V sporulation protein D (sporulation-specific penicillin-binding protein)